MRPFLLMAIVLGLPAADVRAAPLSGSVRPLANQIEADLLRPGGEGRLSAETTSRMIKAAASRDSHAATVALYGLAFATDKDSLRLLEAEAKVRSPKWTSAGALAWRRASQLPFPERLRWLEGRMRSSANPRERLFLVAMLGRFHLEAAKHILIEALLLDLDEHVAFECAIALSRLNDPWVLETILREVGEKGLRRLSAGPYIEFHDGFGSMMCIVAGKWGSRSCEETRPSPLLSQAVEERLRGLRE